MIKDDVFNITDSRRETESSKWNLYPESVLPMWIADSDYDVPQIIKALKQRLYHAVFGYASESESFRNIIVSRMKKLYNWEINPEWICFIAGVIPGLNISRLIMGTEGTKAITGTPVYPHLRKASPMLSRDMQFFEMININGRYTPDFTDLEKNITKDTKMLILCNPHNPIGIVYTKDELQKFVDIAEKYDLMICSDDIHSDFPLYSDKPYTPIASISQSISQRTITLMSASKTFNIAGLVCSFAIIENSKYRKQFQELPDGLAVHVNVLGMIASETAYLECNEWLEKQIVHIRENAEYCYNRINDITLLYMNKMEATFLAWIDVSKIKERVAAKGYASVRDCLLCFDIGVSCGSEFGDDNVIRINLATSKDLLTLGLDRIEKAINKLL